MKKYAADNLLFLRESYPEIYKLVRNQTYDPAYVRISESRNGMPNLIVQDSDTEKPFYSQYNPVKEALKWRESIDEQAHAVEHIIVYGLGFGYHLEAMLEAYPNKKFYVYEPEIQFLLAAMECRDLRSVMRHPGIAIFAVGDDIMIRAEMLRGVFRGITGSLECVVPTPYQRIYPERIYDFSELIVRIASEYRSALATVTHFQKEWTENLIINMERNLRTPPFTGLKGKCSGVPAIIVGSGPSLNDSIEILAKLRDHALIIASGSSIQALLNQGIEPHLVVSMDPGEPNRRVFADLDVKEIPFLYIPTIKHTAIDDQAQYLMHAFFTIDHISYYLMGLTEEDAFFVSSPTVSGTAVQAAYQLGCSEIVFVGQDFSFPDGQYYAAGLKHANQRNINKIVNESNDTIENVAGGWNKTNRTMLGLKVGLEAILDQLPFDRYYNASPFGAVIRHTQPKSLETLYEETRQVSRHQGWLKLLFKESLRHYPESRIKSIRSKIEQAHKQVEELPKQFAVVSRLMDDVGSSGNESSAHLKQWLDAFDASWLKLTNNLVFKHIYCFLLQREVNYLERYWQQIQQESSISKKRQMLKQYTAPLIEAERKVSPVLLSSMDKLISRLNLEVPHDLHK